MAVKIIGYDRSVVKQVTCKNCGAVLEYVKSDVKTSTGRDYSGSVCGTEWIKCPECRDEVVVNAW